MTLTIGTAAALALTAGPVAAGEWNANGERTGAYGNGNSSACSFSGLDENFIFEPDSPEVEEDEAHGDTFTHTQNYGQIVKAMGPLGKHGFTPAVSGCNKTRGGGEE